MLPAKVFETVDELVRIAKEAQEKNEHHLAIVTGVPGAGKTLVGLQLVHDERIPRRSAVFLSGNGPLISVLQDALKDHIFVIGVHDFLRQYGSGANKQPVENIMIFDEAQRAWDQEKASGFRPGQVSEPEQSLEIGAGKSWGLMVALVGEGQEIYRGEESGMGQWDTAVHRSRVPWVIHCSEKSVGVFTSAKAVQVSENLISILRCGHIWPKKCNAGAKQFWMASSKMPNSSSMKYNRKGFKYMAQEI